MTIKTIENSRCCGSCRFYFEEGRQCRRYPPQAWSESQSEYSCSLGFSYPEVNKDEWCGEFREIEQWVLPKGFKILDADGTEQGEM